MMLNISLAASAEVFWVKSETDPCSQGGERQKKEVDSSRLEGGRSKEQEYLFMRLILEATDE